MGFRRQPITLISLITLLVASSVMLGWALSDSRIHLAILSGIAVVLDVVLLYIQMNRTIREVLFFFSALENDDTSFRYRSNYRSRFIDELHQYLNKLNESYQEMKLDHEKRELYFSQILEHLSSGLLVIAGTGHINHINEEARRLLNLQQLTHTRALFQKYPALQNRIKGMKSMDRAEINIQDGETGLKKVLGLQLVDINLRGEDVRVVTIHDLSAGMERKEIDDWIRLIRVMSHEIMNSLAPITSISTTLRELWDEHTSGSDGEITEEAIIQQTMKGLDAIADQSEGLTTFFESYRVLSRIPDPVMKEISVPGLFEKLETLVSHFTDHSGISISFECRHPGLKLLADEQMITQVLLNLVKNAVQAIEAVENPEIAISADPSEDRMVLKVTDNGEGIPSEISDQVFMPFFTTRKKGTGVGLSYSRQVMALNNGRIEFDSQPGRTRFRLVF